MKTPESAIKLKNYSIKKSPSLETLFSQLGNVSTLPMIPSMVPSSDLGRVTKAPSKIELEKFPSSDLSKTTKAPSKIELEKIPSSLEAKITYSSDSLLRKVISTTVKGNGRTEKQIVQIAAFYTDPNTYVTPNPAWPDTTGYISDSIYVEI